MHFLIFIATISERSSALDAEGKKGIKVVENSFVHSLKMVRFCQLMTFGNFLLMPYHIFFFFFFFLNATFTQISFYCRIFMVLFSLPVCACVTSSRPVLHLLVWSCKWAQCKFTTGFFFFFFFLCWKAIVTFISLCV